MHFYDRQYEKAREEFADLYKKGDKSISVVVPLAWSELRLGDVRQALERLKTFSEINPESPGNIAAINNLFKTGGKQQELLSLMKRERNEPKVLELQAEIWRHMGDLSKESKALESVLIYKKKERDKARVRLARIRAHEGNFEAARKLMSTVRRLDNSSVEFYVSLLAVLKAYPDAYNLALNYTKENPDRDLTVSLAYKLNHPLYAFKLLQELPEKDRDVEAESEMMHQLGMNDLLYRSLLARYLSKTLPDSLAPLFFELSLKKKDEKILELLVKNGALSTNQLLDVAIKLPVLVPAFPNDQDRVKSLFADKYSMDELLFLHSQWQMPADNSTKARFAVLYAKNGLFPLSVQLIQAMDFFEEYRPAFDLALNLGLASEILPKLDPHSPERLMALAALGDHEAVDMFLKDHQVKTEDINAAFWHALSQKRAETASLLAGTNPIHRALVLLMEKRGEEALTYLRPQEAGNEKEVSPLIIQALALAKITDELQARIDQALSKPNVPLKEKEEYAYLLAEGGLVGASAERFLQLAKEDPEQKGRFYKQIIDLEQGKKIVSSFEEKDLDDESLQELYLQAFVQAEETALVDKTLAYLIPTESRLERLRSFGKIVQGEDFESARELIWKRSLVIAPGDFESLKNLGLNAFWKGRNAQAKFYLYEISQEDWQVLQALGELTKNKSFDERALFLLNQIPSPTKEELLAKAHLLTRLERPRQALRIYSCFLDDKEVRKEIAEVLVNEECYTAARNFLAGECFLPLEIATLHPTRALIISNRALTSAKDWAARADLELQLRRPRLALGALNRAIELDPENENWRKARCEIQKAFFPKWAAEVEWLKTGDTKLEKFARFLWEYGPWKFRVETDHCEINPYLDPSSEEIVDKTGNPYQGELSYRHLYCKGSALEGRFFFGSDVIGAGTLIHLNDLYGTTELYLEYHRPNWDFDQTTLDGGSRDMVAFLRAQELHPYVSAQLGFGLNRYNLNGFSNAGDTWSSEAACIVRLSRKSQPIRLSLNYIFDCEYKIDTRKRSNGFEPLPIINREEHAVFLKMQKEWNDRFSLEVWGGGIYDRQGVQVIAPIYGADITLGNLFAVKAHLHYAHTVSTSNTAQMADSIWFRLEKYIE